MSDARPRRSIGRPRSIDRDKIIAAANEIGLDNLTMRAVAEHLGVTTQALYNHIGGRRELVALMANDYGESFELPAESITDWKLWFSEFARSMRRLLLDRPGMAASLSTRGPTSPNALMFVDRAISQMSAAGFEEREAVMVYKIVVELVIGAVQRQEARDADPTQEQAQSALFYEALANSNPDDLPNLAHIAVGWNRRDAEESFEYTLTCLLAGIEAEQGWLGRHIDVPGAMAARTDDEADD